MKLTYTVEEVAEVLGVSKSSVYNLKNNGTIHAIEKLPGLLFSVEEIHSLVMVNDEYNTFNYRLLKKKCEALETENVKLKNSIKKITSDVLAITGEFVND